MEPLLRELGGEYSPLPQALDFARAGGTPIGKDAHAELARFPDEEFTAPYGGVAWPDASSPSWNARRVRAATGGSN